MKISFRVEGLPPKKDGANSMWRKPSEIGRLKALRTAASAAMAGTPLPTGPVHLTLRIHAEPASGDLDNFITGICDGLMAARAPIDPSAWTDLPAEAHPSHPIAFHDDSCVALILAERLPPAQGAPRYEVELAWSAGEDSTG